MPVSEEILLAACPYAAKWHGQLFVAYATSNWPFNFIQRRGKLTNARRMNSLEDWELRMMDLDEKLQPIAKRPVDIARPGWLERLQAGVPPLDEAGVRGAAERLLAEIIAGYAQGTDHTRAAIRRLFQEYQSFSWAATLSVPRTTIDDLRQHLILFSINDQGLDSRDALITLQEICQNARNAGLEVAPVLCEVAEMSSDADKFGMGSTRQMLLRCC